MIPDRCPAVHFTSPTVPFVVGVPVRCTKPAGHASEIHAGSGYDLDGEVFGAGWRYMLALPPSPQWRGRG